MLEKIREKDMLLKRACEISNGEYIIFCDGDMEIDPSQLENFFCYYAERKC